MEFDKALYEEGRAECESAGACLVGLTQSLLQDGHIQPIHFARVQELVAQWHTGMAKRTRALNGIPPRPVLVDPQATARFDP